MSARRRKRPPVEFRIRLYFDTDDDLIDWLDSLDDDAVPSAPHRTKNQGVREALRRGIAAAQGQPSGPVAATAAWDLSDVRRVVEAAVETTLARLGGQVATPALREANVSTVAPSEDDEAEGLLDTLGESLVLKD
jgi:hypothetical protein